MGGWGELDPVLCVEFFNFAKSLNGDLKHTLASKLC